jgi:hypothetical protein
MTWWVYKCNSQKSENRRVSGDWDDFFEGSGGEWGSKKKIPDLARLRQGDQVIAYQTDRNEIVGLTSVRQSCDTDGYLYLDPIGRCRANTVSSLKNEYSAIDAIKAFRRGSQRAIRHISESEASLLLDKSGLIRSGSSESDEPNDAASRESEAENEADAMEGYSEGGKHSAVQSVRSEKLREAAKRKYGLECYCCGFKFEDFYGEIARDRTIVHHLETFSGTNGTERVSTVKDVRVVCANCHYVIHFSKIPMDVDELKSLIETK